MKAAFLSAIFFIVILSKSLQAQSLAWTFADSGMVWCQSMTFGNPYDGIGGTDQTIYNDGSYVVMSGKRYYNLFHTGYSYFSRPIPFLNRSFFHEPFALYRNDTIKQEVELMIGADTMQYKSNLNVGDTINWSYNFGTGIFIVDSITTIWIGGLPRRIFYYVNWGVGYLIEGIGPFTGLGEDAFGHTDYGAFLNNFTVSDSSYRILPWSLPTYLPGSCGIPVNTQNIPNKTSISLYPNPASDKIILKLNHPFQYATLQLRNVYGQLIYSEEIQQNENEKTININSLSAGSYLAILKTDSGSSIKKLLVIR